MPNRLSDPCHALRERTNQSKVVDIHPTDGGDLSNRPAHGVRSLLIAQPALGEEFGAESTAQIVQVLGFLLSAFWIDVEDLRLITNAIDGIGCEPHRGQ